ncbi:SRPBCC domain-containing protein [Candidatus Kapabacteria bacterium]|nr:SRPBCC domain-containing protein [Candidatus Kapabacteria bacterium]
MQSTLKLSQSISSNTQKVWEVLTKPDHIKTYMFDCDVITNWQIGNPIKWNLTSDGVSKTLVHGVILEFEEFKKLKYTVFPSESDLNDIPQNYITIEHLLTEENGVTLLELNASDYSKIENGSKRYEDSVQGWNYAFPLIKQIAESL